MREEQVAAVVSEDEKNIIEKACREVYETKSTFLRKAAIERARSELRHRSDEEKIAG